MKERKKEREKERNGRTQTECIHEQSAEENICT